MGHYNHSLSVDATIMVYKNSPIIIRFLCRVVLETRVLQSVLLINDRHKLTAVCVIDSGNFAELIQDTLYIPF